MKQMKLWMFAAILTFCGLTTTLTSCSKDDDNNNKWVAPPAIEYFQSWNQCEALTALKTYVEDVTNPQSPNYISPHVRAEMAR